MPTFMKESYCIYRIVFNILYLTYIKYNSRWGQITQVNNDYICVEPTHMEYNNRVVK